MRMSEEEVEELKEQVKALREELDDVKARCVLKEEPEISVSYPPETTTVEIPTEDEEEIEEAESTTESEESEEGTSEGPTEEREG